MRAKVKAMVITGYGTNCEMEMAQACRLGGADQVDIVHLSELLHGRYRLDDYQLLNLAGGFLDGDNLGAGQAGAHRWLYAKVQGSLEGNGENTGDRQALSAQLFRFIKAGKLIIGVCNGFQLLAKMGLLPAFDQHYDQRLISLTHNDSSRFENRWVHLRVEPGSPCVFTKGLDQLYLPVRHGEGKFVTADETVLQRLKKKNQIVLRYAHPQSGEATTSYPWNPNGSPEGIAGICDPSGRILGLMPHPEAFLQRTNHPRWTREELPEEGQGVALFRNGIDFIRENSR